MAYGQTRTISGTAGWRMISIPKAGATVTDISDDTAIQGVTGGSNAGDAANIYYNPGSGGSGGWTVPTNMSTAWGDGLGAIVYFYNNTTGGSSELPLDLDVSGSEPGSDVKVTITNDFTLMGNPFQSNINVDDITGNATGVGLLFGGIKSSIKVWNNSAGSYSSYNLGSNLVLAEWQGIFIEKATGLLTDLTEVTIPTSSKTASAAGISHYSKSRAFDTRSIDLHLTGEGFNDLSTKFYFTPYSSEQEDQFDGSKLSSINGSPTIAFVQDFGEGKVLLNQDARSLDPETTQSYDLEVNDAGISGEYTLNWETMKQIPSDWTITLIDREEDIYIDMQSETSYSFNVEAKQKRANVTSLRLGAVKQKSVNNSNPRFGITISPSTAVSIDDEIAAPTEFALGQNYPNPFNPTTNIQYSVGEAGPVNITVYNVMGQKVAELLNTTKSAGSYQVSWNATGQASGIYYYRLTAPGQVLTRQMTLIK
ncbi:MAG: T9SS type A sorting domain-containing protein [Balneola sp.]|nr:T9SS type A sorting domain-containing protein [Balneola sp.]